MEIYCGNNLSFDNVTEQCFKQLTHNQILTIPASNDDRISLFGNISPDNNHHIIIKTNNKLFLLDNTSKIVVQVEKRILYDINEQEINDTIDKIHRSLSINHGTLDDELPEQKMSVKFLTGNEKVLEIGGNIGRNSLIISTILSDSSNLVTLETSPSIYNQLVENRDKNGHHFHIENSALSKRRLIQRDWNTVPSEELWNGWEWVNTITYDDLQKKYNIVFDTLVLDCEGAFFYILEDFPDMLNNINLIIMENDYQDINNKRYVDSVLENNNFYPIYREAGGWGCCFNNFFEVWKR
jgi:FkbM family methyltransferase